jgi:hypothetical protein
VDEKRIYVTGWSNGAYWAAQYAIVRHDQATPGGHVVAAAAVYAGADPFADFDATASPSCRPSTYPQTQVPLLIIHRNCDALVACDSTQRTAFNLPPQSDVEGFLSTLAGAGADLHTQDLIIDRNGAVVSACDPTCSRLQGTLNHVRWPDGVADNGGQDHELDLLAFLRANPHP